MPFTIVRNDLTRMSVDAIVNTANPKPLIGTGTDSAIYKTAGAEKLLKERIKIGEIARGEAAITGAYSLPAKYIIHTVGPVWIDGNSGEADLLRSCYRNSLALALKRKCKSIAFPLISTGNYGFPKDLALKIVVETVEQFLTDHDMMIFLVVFGSDTTRLSEKLFSEIEELITDDYAEAKAAEEYALNYDLGEELSNYDRRRDRRRDLYSEEEDGFPSPEARLEDGASFPESRREDYSSAYDLSSAPKPTAHIEEDACYEMPDEFPMAEASHSYDYPVEKSSEKSSVLKSLKPSKRTLEKLLAQKNETFSQMLLRLIKERGITNAQAYKKANQDKRLFSKIKNDKNYSPDKKTVLAFALGLELTLDETKDLLLRAGYAFSPSNNFDKVIQYCIETQEYNIFEIEIILYDLGLESLCKY